MTLKLDLNLGLVFILDLAFRLSSFDWLNNGPKSHKGPRVFEKFTNIFGGGGMED